MRVRHCRALRRHLERRHRRFRLGSALGPVNDAETGAHVWAERFDQQGADPPALMDAVTGRIIASVAAERGAVKQAQFREAWGRDSASLGEYDYFLRGLDIHMNAENKVQNDRSAAIWREGLEQYPASTLLKAKLAWYHWTAAWYWWSDDLTADFREAGRLVEEVLAEDGLTPEVRRIAHWLYALVKMQRGAFDEAVAEAEYAIGIAPYDARILRYLSEVMLAAGEYETALDWLDTAEARNPARSDDILLSRANIYRLMGRPEDAIAAFETQTEMMPYMHLSAAIAHLRLGQIDEAQARVAEALAIEPGFIRTWWRDGSFYSDPSILDSEIADLTTAGLPE